MEYGERPIRIHPGVSYWLLAKNSTQAIGSGPGYSVPTAEPYTMGTAYGWHLIANPFTFDLSIAQVTSWSDTTPRSLGDLIDSGILNLVSFDGTEFVEVADTLRAHQGYALYVADCPHALFQCSTSTSGGLSFYADPAMTP